MLNIDENQIEKLLDLVKQQAVSFLNTIEQRPTSSDSEVQTSKELSIQSLGTEKALNHFIEKFDAAIVASTGPRYWGYVTGGATPAAIVGDCLAAVYDPNTQATYGQGDISAVIELKTIALFFDLFGFPDYFTAGFVTGATQSNVTFFRCRNTVAGKTIGIGYCKTKESVAG